MLIHMSSINIKKEIMKLTLNTESSSLLIEAKKISGVNFNSLIKEAMELLLIKYIQQHKDQHDPNKHHETQRN